MLEFNRSFHQSQIGTNLIEIFEFIVFFLRFLIDVIYQMIKSFIKTKPKNISGNIVVITGTAHGIGQELALQYADLDCTVICIDINEKGNLETVEKCNELLKGKAYGFVCDVTNRNEVLSLADKIRSEIGLVSVLINNAGIMPTHPIEQQSVNEIQAAFNINCLSHFWTIQAFLPHMKKNQYGHIIGISSIAGIVGLANIVPYCATKFAVRGLMEALNDELRSGPYNGKIHTTTIFPYMVNTGLCKNPKIKFPKILGLLEPKFVASSIINAHRTNVVETTLPYGLLPFNNFCRLLPLSSVLLIKDYIGSGVESDNMQ